MTVRIETSLALGAYFRGRLCNSNSSVMPENNADSSMVSVDKLEVSASFHEYATASLGSS
ncbi:hypothetical protein RP726_11490 [Candidatus Methylospira mobilis]|uniref:hypothetical protein n=1 Tax=Candidatus Methylospira mobilis TaxID=1808979 RepID=UPI0028F161A7|nr:hypothetical protein [Candidatus Methylospira mobilis]WNV03093.1 hypothetical protein RP726_11490 [Candidatus Methylospira mobilis]